MKKILILSVLIVLNFMASGQKKIIDVDAIKNWRRITDYNISSDGQFIWYATKSDQGNPNLTITDNHGESVLSLADCSEAVFSPDSKYIFVSGKEGVHWFNLNTRQDNVIKGASDILLLYGKGTKKIAYTKNDSLKILDVISNSTRSYQKTQKKKFIPHQNLLLLIKDSSVNLLNIVEDKATILTTGVSITDCDYDSGSSSIILLSMDRNKGAIFKYTLDRKNKWHANEVKFDSSFNKYNYYTGTFRLGRNGLTAGFRIYPLEGDESSKIPDKRINGPMIWDYKDKFLLSNLPFVDKPEKWVSISFKKGTIHRLWTDSLTTNNYRGNQYAIIKSITNELEAYWNRESSPKYFLRNVENDIMFEFIPKGHKPVNVILSPHEKYVTWIDTASTDLFCYNIKTKIVKNVSIQIKKISEIKKLSDAYSHAIDQWFNNDKYLILHDKYDIYQINPSNLNELWYLTGDHSASAIKFRPAEELDDKDQDSILLAVKEDCTQKNGFVKVRLRNDNASTINFVDTCLYYFPEIGSNSRMPLKTKLLNTLLVMRQTAEEQPNLYLIKDLQYTVKISEENYDKNYNWFKAKLIKTKLNDSTINYGILYLPELLDTTRKYPIIFNYYMIRSYERFQFRYPDLSAVNVNVPWYLSRGYIVCVVDIKSSAGNTGNMALECVEKMADYLSRNYSCIDSTRMGLQGQSFGGYITNFIVTHSSRFAAAQASSGSVDLISKFGALGFGELSLQNITEIGQTNMRTTPWLNPEVYINNSTVFTSHKVTTPLLLMHGKYDNAVKFNQSVELFTSLRRAEKPVWLLEYPIGHIMSDEELSKDFQIKQQDFFDHYLKDGPKPLWMK